MSRRPGGFDDRFPSSLERSQLRDLRCWAPEVPRQAAAPSRRRSARASSRLCCVGSCRLVAMTPCARAVLAAVLVAASHSFSHLSEHSFEPPFNSFDRDGIRRIDGWKYGGAAGVSEHFVRLTPDRQSKRGWLWNDAKVMADGWSATLRFRISGQGRAMYGDGLAFWFTTDSFYVPGDLHGHSDRFRGFAVIFDTFRNQAAGHAHKDILLLSSDGESPVRAGATDPPPLGCDADVRFWEGRQDFSVANRSATRVAFNASDNSVSVYVDARGSGDWRPCIERATLPLPANWWRGGGLGRGAGGAYMGLTASTGDLADNHDLLSLHVGLEDEVAPEGGAAGREGHLAIISSGSPEVDAAIRSVVDREAVRLNERLLYMHHHLEHAMSSTGDSLKLAIRKLNEQEAVLERRLQELERRVVGAVSSEVSAALDVSLADRLAKLEQLVASQVQQRITQEVLPGMETRMASSGRAWMLPYAVLAGLLIAALVVGWNRYRYLLKRHLL